MLGRWGPKQGPSRHPQGVEALTWLVEVGSKARRRCCLYCCYLSLLLLLLLLILSLSYRVMKLCQLYCLHLSTAHWHHRYALPPLHASCGSTSSTHVPVDGNEQKEEELRYADSLDTFTFMAACRHEDGPGILVSSLGNACAQSEARSWPYLHDDDTGVSLAGTGS